MKILTLYRQDKAITATLPIPAMLEMIEGAHRYVEELRKKGKITEGGIFAGIHGGFAVFNVSSMAELHELTELNPARQMLDLQLFPMLEPAEFGQVFGKIKSEAISRWQKLQQTHMHHH